MGHPYFYARSTNARDRGHSISRLLNQFCVPVVIEGIDLVAEVFYGCVSLLLKIGGVFARGLEQVFGVVEFVDEAASCFIAFESREVVAAASLIGSGGLFLLL
jgi:hypothetical protein